MRGVQRLWFAIGTISEQSALLMVRIIGNWTFVAVDLWVTLAFPAIFTDKFISIETRFYDTAILMASLVIARAAARQATSLARMVGVLERSMRDQRARDEAQSVALAAIMQELVAIRRGGGMVMPERSPNRNRQKEGGPRGLRPRDADAR